jgi:hypothetical protein
MIFCFHVVLKYQKMSINVLQRTGAIVELVLTNEHRNHNIFGIWFKSTRQKFHQSGFFFL